jgi:hypothetical protein
MKAYFYWSMLRTKTLFGTGTKFLSTKFLTEGGGVGGWGGGAAGGNQTSHQAGPLTYELRRTQNSTLLWVIEGFFKNIHELLIA